MIRSILSFSIIFLVALIHVGFTQDEVPEKVSLASLVDRALNRSESVKAAQLQIEEKQFSAQQSRSWQNPEVSLSGGHKQASPQDHSEPAQSGLLYEASISQPFFFPGKQKLRGDIGKLEAEAAKVKYSETEIMLVYDVIKLSYDYEINRRRKALAESRLHRFEVIQSYLSGHVFASPQQKAERLIVERRFNNLTADTLKSHAALKTAYEKLNLLVGWERVITPEIAVPWLQGKAGLDPSESLKSATTRNFNLASQRLLVRSAQKENRLAKWENFPDFVLFGSYAQEKAGDTERFLKGGISFSIPLLNQHRGDIRSTARKIEAENALLRFNEQQIQSQLAQLHTEYEIAREIVQRYPEASLGTLEKHLREIEQEFRKGRVSLITFIELDSEISQTYERTLEAQVSLLDKLMAISFLAGNRDFISRLSEF